MPDSEKSEASVWAETFAPFKEAFVNKRVAFMAPLGFASGLPLTLTGSTLSAWFRTEGVDLTTIGLLSWVTLIYSLKFLWAPLLDRFQLPWLSRRRGWMVTFQLALIGAIAALGMAGPGAIAATVAVAFVVALLGASQDVVIDAYRTDVLRPNERASGVAIFVMAYRVALIVSGAGALILSDLVPWDRVYVAIAALMVVGVVATYFAPVPERKIASPPTIVAAVITPFVDFFSRRRAIVLFIIVMTYKVGDTVASQMLTPFLIDLDFSRTEIGAIQKGLGLVATIVGALLGGGLVAKLGILRALLIFGVLQAVANVLYAVLAVLGHNYVMLVVAIGVDNLFNGLGQTAFVAFLMSLCNPDFSATQYALLSSAMSFFGKLLGGGSGLIAEYAGWPAFFLITLAVALPALFLIWFIPKDAVDSG